MLAAQMIRRFSFEEWGGTENVVWNSSLALQYEGIDSEIFATSALSRPGEEVRKGILIRRYPYFYPHFPLSAKAKLALDKKGGGPCSPKMEEAMRSDDLDLIHVHSGGRFAQIALAMAKHLHIPCVMSLHGGYSDVPENEMRQMLNPLRYSIPYGGIMDRLTGRHEDPVLQMDAVICVGENEYDTLRARHPGRHIYFIPNGIDVKKFQTRVQTEESVYSRFQIPEGRKILLCVSRIDYQKNQKMLLPFLREQLKQDSAAHLVLVGPITAEQYGKELSDEIKNEGLSEHVTWIPGLSPDDPMLVKLLQTAHVFLLPSLHEPFGIVILEAWAAGVPVLSTNAGGAGRLVTDGETGLLFSPNDLDSLLHRYQRFENDSALQSKLRENAGNKVRDYSWKATAGKLASLYHEVINAGQR